ncbi:porphobilinogen synthase [Mucisphaera calidilacus]|uniref:Delta-aminolevulinic acid dehydratase n=1 Tax=Mucisphaera calidilacus TaxID=2527982 RepID=A0A518BZR6_9BACT|nr:porphobilinogen synthase [Mucisphaera calidilacus]QDU72464.1 Delta-aminolevulinic acid dehydratase [Mucisphaera calidilacus]
MPQDSRRNLIHRPRRLRRSQTLRDLVADVRLHPANLILPLFVAEIDRPQTIDAMPGVRQWPVDDAIAEIKRLIGKGLRSFLLFGVTPQGRKNALGNDAENPASPVLKTLRAARDAGLDALMIADLCLCEYTDHGHCGPLCDQPGPDGFQPVDNDAALERLATIAVAQAQVGADIVAPSGMMDGQVAAIRAALDDAGHHEVPILSYAVKYASSLYGPFRDAGGGSMSFGHRRGYQMDPRHSREWRTELRLDLEQGADMVMVKPAGHYLDVVAAVRAETDLPVAAYHVSGEYGMVEAAARNGWIDRREAHIEIATAIRRAGADLIVTYAAEDLADWLSDR